MFQPGLNIIGGVQPRKPREAICPSDILAPPAEELSVAFLGMSIDIE